MSEDTKIVPVQKEKEKSILRENLEMLSNPDNFQKYILGTKKNGSPRALYDVVKDYTNPGKKSKGGKKKKHKKCGDSTYAFYLNTKKKKHKKKKDHWRLD